MYGEGSIGVPKTMERPFEANSDVIRLSRWVMSPIYPSSTASIPTAFNFKLNNLPGFTDITNMYDQYRITRVDVFYEPCSFAGPTTATGNVGAITLLTRVDFDSNVTQTFDQLRECQNTQVHGAFERWEHSFVPKISQMAYNGATSTGYTVAQGNPWVATSNPDVEYYGFKFAYNQVTSAQIFGGTLCFRVHLEAKNVL